jgi:hypothetical protein
MLLGSYRRLQHTSDNISDPCIDSSILQRSQESFVYSIVIGGNVGVHVFFMSTGDGLFSVELKSGGLVYL